MKLSFLVQIDINEDDEKKLDVQKVVDKLMMTLADTGDQLVALLDAEINYLGANPPPLVHLNGGVRWTLRPSSKKPRL
jgi:hypothetical protein